MKVLVVDDDAVHLLILKKIFEKSEDEVVLAHNGVEALELLERDTSFQIILTDIMMPEMDGVELLLKVKTSLRTMRIPVIGFTSGDVEFYRKKTQIPFDSLVPKPLDFWDLHELAKRKAIALMN
ncbi:response regulator [Algoriphagus vanfongensis]|uniref:response regulator n=1 Tax=Algoriphagus vanfongensis TaxID=426371 RepID=UPI0004151A6E|nr:response regulator [Algoriphagus vanfongensis]